MGVDEIITLDDGKDYILLDCVTENDNKYFLACESFNNEPTENYKIFKEIVENNELSVEDIEDKDMLSKILRLYNDKTEESK